jgi:hypothetical protein
MGDRCGAGRARREPDNEHELFGRWPSLADADTRYIAMTRLVPQRRRLISVQPNKPCPGTEGVGEMLDTSPKADRSKFGKTKAYLRFRIA